MLEKILHMPFVQFLKAHLRASKKYWSIRKITFVAILISISVTAAIIGVTIIPIASIPSYKLSFTGLPIKISGFIFGPIIGFFIGIIADILSILFIPSYIHWGYILVSGINGLVPGLVSVILFKFLTNWIDKRSRLKSIKEELKELQFNKTIEIDLNRITKLDRNIKWRKAQIEKLDKQVAHSKINSEKMLGWIYLFTTWFFIGLAATINITVILEVIDPSTFEKSLLKSQINVIILTSVGFVSIFIFILFARFKMKFEKFSIIGAIISFSVILESVQVYLLAYTDSNVLRLEFVPALIQHIFTAPIKVWFNMVVIYFSWKVINYLLNRNKSINL
ncbi:ECF transporter S component [Mycoplasmopsis agassizii]|uniref:ECF transporter S component n=1 Tax=Mycoplasmopsis agassizii TaxID=33922 RepID=UPI00117E81A9|nr:ECF transporter S component [Mycoplasmopsis agassizii]